MIHHDQCFHSCRRTEAIPKGSDPNIVEVIVFDRLGPIYTKRQHQCCDNSAMTVEILFSLKQWSRFRMVLQPILKQLHCFQSDQYC